MAPLMALDDLHALGTVFELFAPLSQASPASMIPSPQRGRLQFGRQQVEVEEPLVFLDPSSQSSVPMVVGTWGNSVVPEGTFSTRPFPHLQSENSGKL